MSEHIFDPYQTVPFSIIGAHGEVIGSGISNCLPDGGGNTVLDVLAPQGRHWWDGTQFHPVGEPPSVFHTYDWPSHSWVDERTVDQWRTIKWADVKAARAERIAAGVAVDGVGRLDADPAAVAAFSAVLATLDAKPDDWTIVWTGFHNDLIALDKARFRQVAAAVLGHGPAVHAVSQQLRHQIDAATEIGQLINLRWPE